MNFREYIPAGSLLFAPMEGVTDGPYRLAMMRSFPEWDQFSTDFLRVPTVGNCKTQHILKHLDERIYANQQLKEKTSFQILTTARAKTLEAVSALEELKIKHMDLNLGCPSKKVNSHGGGAFLLSDLTALRSIIKEIRSHFSRYFTVKIRIGYKDDKNFEQLIRLFEEEGVDAITIHARTRDQLYKGRANWDYIKKACEISSLPIIGNGDLWTLEDIDQMFSYCGCHAVMLGRGALKTPWMASFYKKYKKAPSRFHETYLLQERSKYIEEYFDSLEKEYRKTNKDDDFLLRRFKSLSHYLFDDYQNSDEIRSRFLRSRSLGEFQNHLTTLVSSF